MRSRSLTILTGFTLLVATSTGLSAQGARFIAMSPESDTGSSLLERHVSLEFGKVTLATALTRLQEASGVPISFSPTMLPDEANVSCKCEGTTLGNALVHVLRGSGFGFLEVTDQVVIIRRPADGAVAELSGSASASNGNSATSRVVLPVAKLATRTLQPAMLPVLGQIVGTVLHATSGEPIPDVHVSVAQTQLTTLTGPDGRFTIANVPAGTHTVVAQLIGYGTERTTVTVRDGETTTLNVRLIPAALALDEIVVVGYGEQRRQNLTGAVSVVDVGRTLGSRPVADVARGLQGAAPGLTITTLTGKMGEEPSIRLRGTVGSLNTGSDGARPLILVDGVEVESLQLLNPDDIESISVLKDAASASIYGARAAFGVVLITTKTGQRGAGPRFTYSNNISYNTPLQKFKLMSAPDQIATSLAAVRRFAPDQNSFQIIGITFDEYAQQRIQEWQQQYGNQKLSNEMVYGRDFEIRDGQLYFFRPWDPAEMYMRDWTPQQKHNLNISGGSDRTSYNIGLGYLDQDGVLKVNSDEYKRYNISLALDSDVTDWLGVRSRFWFSKTNLKTPYVFQSEQFNQWYYLYRWTTIMPYGTYQGLPFHNAITETEQANLNSDEETFARVSTSGTIRVADNLTVDAEYTYSQTNEALHEKGGGVFAWEFWGFDGQLRYENYLPPTHNRVAYTSGRRQNNTGRLYATYRRPGEHAFQLITGGDLELTKYTSHRSERRNLLDFDNAELNLATGDQFVSGSATQWSTLGAFGRLNYTFRDKLMLEFNARYDGSSRFPLEQLWGFFPSASAGYVLTQEPFMDFTRGFLDFFKVRVSYGSVGNQNVGANRFLALMNSTSSGWLLPNGIARTMTTPGAVSPSLTWETVTTANLGFDANMLQNRLGISFDVYRRTTSDMISSGTTLPATFGASAPVRNFGELQAQGWELMVNYNQEFSNGVTLGVTGSFADGREKITKFFNPSFNITQNYEGKYIGEIWGFETDRLFQEDDFEGIDPVTGRWIYKAGIPNQNALESGAFRFGPGDIKFKDLNGDGEITLGAGTVDDPGDRRIIGNETPRYQYGLRVTLGWKGIDFATYLQGVGSRQLWHTSKLITPGRDNSTFGAAWFDYQIDYWRPDNTDAFYARPTNNDNWNYRTQTRYLLDMSYLRVKNITLGYTLPRLNYLPVDVLRVYVSGENLFTLDNLGNIPIDPETGVVNNTIGASYPYRGTISFGLQTTF